MGVSTYRSVNSSNDRGASYRIADAACHLFAEQGFAATSMRQIASAAGVTKPMVYYYFGSKEALLSRMVEQSLATVEARIEAALAPAGSCRDKLERLAQVHAELSQSNLLELAGRSPFDQAVRDLLAEGQRRGEIRSVDANLFAATFCGGLAALDPANPTGPFVDILWHGLA